jgi:hypothetical protein
VAIFKNVEWEPTRHHGPSVSVDKIETNKENIKEDSIKRKRLDFSSETKAAG